MDVALLLEHFEKQMSVARIAHAAELAAVRRERDEALASERRLWAAYAMAKGAAERASASLGLTYAAWADMPAGLVASVHAKICDATDDIRTSEKLAGCAVEEAAS